MNSEIEIEGFRRMLRIRGFEQAVTRLINEGEVPGACHSSIGQRRPSSAPAWLCARMTTCRAPTAPTAIPSARVRI